MPEDVGDAVGRHAGEDRRGVVARQGVDDLGRHLESGLVENIDRALRRQVQDDLRRFVRLLSRSGPRRCWRHIRSRGARRARPGRTSASGCRGFRSWFTCSGPPPKADRVNRMTDQPGIDERRQKRWTATVAWHGLRVREAATRRRGAWLHAPDARTSSSAGRVALMRRFVGPVRDIQVTSMPTEPTEDPARNLWPAASRL